MIIKILKQLKNTKFLQKFANHNIKEMQKKEKQSVKQVQQIIKQGNKQLLVQGKAKIYTKYIQTNQNNQLVQNQVFYNPVQIFNRDMTILVMQTFIQLLKEQRQQKFNGVNIVDALSASGLRTIRFLKELEGVKMVYANDLSPSSHKLMKDNFQLNQLDQTKYKMTLQDANLLLINSKRDILFDIVDLDPYGSVVPFLDASVESIINGGLLCITCTDNKVTAGPDYSKCFYYYGSTRARVHHFNENALRVVLSTISAAASRHCKYIEPIISFQTEFYLRVFVRVHRGRKQCHEVGLKIGNVYNCNACGNYQYSSFMQLKKKTHFNGRRNFISSNLCNLCDEPYYLNGPVWLSDINNIEFARRMIGLMQDRKEALALTTHKKIYGTLISMLNQGQLAKIPLGFNFSKMCKTLHSPIPNRSTLISGVQSMNKSYQIVQSYISPGLYKTNAPFKAIYDFIKSWKMKEVGQSKYIGETKLNEEFSLRILKKELQFQPDFSYVSDRKTEYVPRFIKIGDNMGPKGKPLSRIINDQHQIQQNDQQLIRQIQQQSINDTKKKQEK